MGVDLRVKINLAVMPEAGLAGHSERIVTARDVAKSVVFQPDGGTREVVGDVNPFANKRGVSQRDNAEIIPSKGLVVVKDLLPGDDRAVYVLKFLFDEAIQKPKIGAARKLGGKLADADAFVAPGPTIAVLDPAIVGVQD